MTERTNPVYDPTLQPIFNEIQQDQNWIDCGTYYKSKYDQRTDPWLHLHLGRVSGSTIGTCVGHSKFSTPEEKGLELTGEYTKTFTQKELDNMNYGTLTEDDNRKWNEQKYDIKIVESGMVVPKWNKHLGYSSDGDIEGRIEGTTGKGIFEAKGVKKMYWPLIKYMNTPLEIRREKYPIYDQNGKMLVPSHIWRTHYDQMITGMAVLEASHCLYSVYCPSMNMVFSQVIFFNRDYWCLLYSETQLFLETHVISKLKNTPFPLVPKSYDKSIIKLAW